MVFLWFIRPVYPQISRVSGLFADGLALALQALDQRAVLPAHLELKTMCFTHGKINENIVTCGKLT
jgi:hypothetical protein